MKNPMQPIVKDDDGTPRFRKNAIVAYLFRHGPLKMTEIVDLPFTIEDFAQFLQLIGYTTCGFGEYECIPDDIVAEVQAAVEALDD